MGQAAELAAQHPDIKFVVDHIGCPYRRDDEGYADWLKNMKVCGCAADTAYVCCSASNRVLSDSAISLP